MKQQWCRTNDIHTFNGQKLTEENAPEKCKCSDCGELLKVYPRSDGTYYVRRHKIKDRDAYFGKLKFEQEMKKVRAQHEKQRLSLVNSNTMSLYKKVENDEADKGVV